MRAADVARRVARYMPPHTKTPTRLALTVCFHVSNATPLRLSVSKTIDEKKARNSPRICTAEIEGFAPNSIWVTHTPISDNAG